MSAAESKLKAASKAHTVYKTEDGTRVPGVTTITGLLNKPAMIHAAWELGMKGVNYREYWDALANVGTVAHRMILEDLRGGKVDKSFLSSYSADVITLSENSFASYLAWKAANKIEPVFFETALVSELFRYGGTADLLGYVNDKLTLVDFKTGGIYPEHFIQLAGYSALVNEKRPALGLIEKYILLGIPRKAGETFEVKTKDSLVAEWDVFQNLLQAYRRMKEF